MNNIDSNQIIQYFKQNSLILTLFLAILIFLLIFFISKTLRKSGLFFLIVTFLIDRIIRTLPIDLYGTFPILSFLIMGMYFVGIFIFLFKILKILFAKAKKEEEIDEEAIAYDRKKESKLRKFLSYTGSLPLLIMVGISLVNSYINILPKTFLSNITSLSFLLMVFVSLINTYKYIDKKEIVDDFDKMNFKDLKEDLEKKEKKNQFRSNDNKGRRTLKTSKSKNEVKIDKDDKKDQIRQNRSILKDIKYRDEIKYDWENYKDKNVDSLLNDIKEQRNPNNNLIGQVTKGFESPMNKTIMAIKDLKSGESRSYATESCIAKIIEDEQYKVDLEFKGYNEYDYGKFIDILLEYSKDKKSYKFELELIPKENPSSRIVFYDPSDIFDANKKFSTSFQGKNISLNFPKYKINFVSGN
ncbi:MAG: hypothetical protein PUG67_03245 [Peptoniphilaceae bacterium]|nr:hypothetical protein [Peptoniphilaceae bacterium]MDY6019117.1 hypothetical protein [Anaerococcus sp.]